MVLVVRTPKHKISADSLIKSVFKERVTQQLCDGQGMIYLTWIEN